MLYLGVLFVGSRGPVPKRSEDRVRRNGGGVQKVEVASGRVGAPFYANPDWCPAVRRLWDSMEESGQARFYERSDWAFAMLIFDQLNEYVLSERKNGQILSSLLSSLTSLLLTEGDRRRAGIELSRASDGSSGDDAQVTMMREWQRRMA